MERFLVPIENPRYLDLNSYYLDLPKLIEHFKENSFTGCIHMHSTQAEGIVFFDADEILGSHFLHEKRIHSGESAFKELLAYAQEHSFVIDIYDITPDQIYFWANLPEAELLYRDLNAEFTDLEGLIKKMSMEKLSGYIIIALGKGQEKGYILFHKGKRLPQICYFNGRELLCLRDGPDRLIQQSRDSGGTFHVKQVSPKGKHGNVYQSAHTMEMLEELLALVDATVSGHRKYKNKFDTLLKKKFLDKADQYECIDPFLCEFSYENGSIHYTGNSSLDEVAKGVCESIAELAHELGLEKQLLPKLGPWKSKYKYTVRALGLPWFHEIDA